MFNKLPGSIQHLMVKDIIVIYRKNETILILISLKRYFSHPKKSIFKSSLMLRRHCHFGPRTVDSEILAVNSRDIWMTCRYGI